MTATPPPSLIALAGPNGAGKSTTGPALLKDTLGVTEFVNADLIAQGISPFATQRLVSALNRCLLRVGIAFGVGIVEGKLTVR